MRSKYGKIVLMVILVCVTAFLVAVAPASDTRWRSSSQAIGNGSCAAFDMPRSEQPDILQVWSQPVTDEYAQPLPHTDYQRAQIEIESLVNAQAVICNRSGVVTSVHLTAEWWALVYVSADKKR